MGALPFFQDGKPLSQREIDEKRPEYIETILDWADALDKIITAATADDTEAFIWRTLTEEEAGVIADWFLARARKSSRVAGLVRGMMSFRQKIQLFLIFALRAKDTRDHFVEHGYRSPLGNMGRTLQSGSSTQRPARGASVGGGATKNGRPQPANLLPLN